MLTVGHKCDQCHHADYVKPYLITKSATSATRRLDNLMIRVSVSKYCCSIQHLLNNARGLNLTAQTRSPLTTVVQTISFTCENGKEKNLRFEVTIAPTKTSWIEVPFVLIEVADNELDILSYKHSFFSDTNHLLFTV